MIDPIVNLAFSMHKTPGLYALLLGSGISKSVGIPTGQEIRDDLARQVKEISGTDISEDIGYDELLKQLGKTQAERNAILRPYFEPTDEEREQKLKIPSPAHHAIAQLISSGHIRVVLTTNFDRLLEQALANLGITPNVIRSDDMLEGAMPLRHSPITIVQLHGDYLDLRMLNTPEELSDYSDPKNHLLETIFDEYGLIVCGWSARWDTALRKGILRVKSRRYSTYWVEPFELSSEARDVVKQRDATVILEGGETFFKRLSDTIDSLAKINQQHPLTVAVAIERVKKCIPLSEKHIELEDLFREVTEATYKNFSHEISDDNLFNIGTQDDRHKRLLAYFKVLCEIPLNMAATLCWYGRNNYSYVLKTMMDTWSIIPGAESNTIDERKIPALLLLYVCGIAAVHQHNWQYIRALTYLTIPKHSREVNILDEINKNEALGYYMYQHAFMRDEDPLSKRIIPVIRPIFQVLLPRNPTFIHNFDLFEVILAIVSVHRTQYIVSHNVLYRFNSSASSVSKHFTEFLIEGAKKGMNWDFLNILFDGNTELLIDTLRKYRAQAQQYTSSSINPDIPDYATAFSDNLRL